MKKALREKKTQTEIGVGTARARETANPLVLYFPLQRLHSSGRRHRCSYIIHTACLLMYRHVRCLERQQQEGRSSRYYGARTAMYTQAAVRLRRGAERRASLQREAAGSSSPGPAKPPGYCYISATRYKRKER